MKSVKWFYVGAMAIALKRLLMDIFHRKRQLSLQIMQRIVVW